MPAVTPKKRFGQHFLKDAEVAGRIADILSPDKANLLEIGPGTGALTRFLIRKPALRLKAVEIDKESCGYLQQAYPGLDLVQGDFLKMDVAPLFEGEEFGVIGNFPYNISTQILFKVIENRQRIPFFAGMFQKEVAERICSPSGSKVYGITSVLAQAYYYPQLLFEVPEHVFEPAPQVKSAVLRLDRKERTVLDCDEPLFFSIVKSAFNQRRKTLRNSLKGFPGDFSGDIFNLRPEQIDVEQFIEITRRIEVASRGRDLLARAANSPKNKDEYGRI